MISEGSFPKLIKIIIHFLPPGVDETIPCNTGAKGTLAGNKRLFLGSMGNNGFY